MSMLVNDFTYVLICPNILKAQILTYFNTHDGNVLEKQLRVVGQPAGQY